jgi:hypothetical protein
MHVLVCGAGGGGGACQTGSNGGNGRATGGAAGGVAVKLFTGVSAGATVSITIGAKGENGQLPSGSSGALTATGGTGGNTSATYSGTTLTGNGGGGGTAAANATERTSNSGGSASGGDTNTTGATSSTNYVTAHTPGNRKAAAGAMASCVSSTQGVPTVDQSVGTGNFSSTVLNANSYTRDEQFALAYGGEQAIPGTAYAGEYYNLNGLYFGIQSAGGRGATNFDSYTYCESGLPGHLGGGGGGVIHGGENRPYYPGKNDSGNQVDNCRGGRGGVGFVHLVFLKAAEDL